MTELKAQLQKARLDFEAFQTSLYAAHPELRAQRGEAQPLRLAEAAALLPDAASALLEYVVTDDPTYLFAVTKAAGQAEAEVHVFTLPIKRAELAKQTKAFGNNSLGAISAFALGGRSSMNCCSNRRRSTQRGKTNLVIVPDDKFWELPFQALLAEGESLT